MLKLDVAFLYDLLGASQEAPDQAEEVCRYSGSSVPMITSSISVLRKLLRLIGAPGSRRADRTRTYIELSALRQLDNARFEILNSPSKLNATGIAIAAVLRDFA